tara:strand:+ start:142 stop:387 length:246 start_codon:yes stop_codon:yes gene_type:complete
MSSSDRLYTVKSSGIHEKGLFSLKDISKGSRIIQYLGEKVTKKESIKRALFIDSFFVTFSPKYCIILLPFEISFKENNPFS